MEEEEKEDEGQAHIKRRVVVALMDAKFVLQPVRMRSEPPTHLQHFIQTVANVQSSSATKRLVTDVKLETFLCSHLLQNSTLLCTNVQKCSSATANTRLSTLHMISI